MSRRAHVWWWTAIVASFVVSTFVSDRLGGDTWPAKSAKGFGLIAMGFYWMHHFTPDDQPPPSVRAHGTMLLWLVLVAIGLGYLFSR